MLTRQEFDNILAKLSKELIAKKAAPAILLGLCDDGLLVVSTSLGSASDTIDCLEEFLSNLRKDKAEQN